MSNKIAEELSPLTIKFSGDIDIPPRKYQNNKTIGDVIIENGYEVIGSLAFAFSNITSISLPRSITTIDIEAFDSCEGLTEFVMNEGLKYIHQRAIRRCINLKVINFSSTVELVSSGSFMSNEKAVVNIPSNNTHLLFEDGLLYNKAKTMIYWSQDVREHFVFPLTVTTTEQDAFRRNYKLITVEWENAGELAGYTFRECKSLTNITFGAKCSLIKSSDLATATSLENIFVDPANPYYESNSGVLMKKNKDTGSVEEVAFFPAKNPTTSFMITESIQTITVSAFSGSKIKEFTVEEGHSKYSGWNGMVHNHDFTILYAVPPRIPADKFSFHENVVEIASGAFYACRLAGPIVVPERIVTIRSNAFAGAFTTNVTLTDKIATLGSGVFSGCSSLAGVFWLPPKLTKVPNLTCSYSGVEEVILHERVTEIGSNAFANTPLKKINLPRSLEVIGANAFLLTYIDGKNLEFCENLVTIDTRAFDSCSELVNIIIPSSVAEIKEEAFYMCGNLELVTIKNCATIVGAKAFYGASETFQSVCIRTRVFTGIPEYTTTNIPRMFTISLAAGYMTYMYTCCFD